MEQRHRRAEGSLRPVEPQELVRLAKRKVIGGETVRVSMHNATNRPWMKWRKMVLVRLDILQCHCARASRIASSHTQTPQHKKAPPPPSLSPVAILYSNQEMGSIKVYAWQSGYIKIRDPRMYQNSFTRNTTSKRR